MENNDSGSKLNVKVVLFDVIGTTIIETREGIINRCFDDAFSFYNLSVPTKFIHDSRGKSKLEVIREVLTSRNRSIHDGHLIYDRFRKNVIAALDDFKPAQGAIEVFEYLQNKNINIALGSGLPDDLFTQMLQRVGWTRDRFSFIGTADDITNGRPDPEMILSLMKNLSISDPKKILKVGDTVSDIREGKNANTITAVVLSGTQSKEMLANENPDFILNDLLALKKLI